jgi:predicted nucleic acid-binding Zn ribbon protein
MERRNLEHIGKALQAFFEANPYIADKAAESRLMQYWQHSMSPAIARYTSNINIRNRTLYVKLTSAVLKNELMLMREQLLVNLNREVGRKVIDEIVFT